MFRFAYPYILYLLLIIPLMIIWFHYNRFKKKKLLNELGKAEIISSLIPDISATKPLWKFYLYVTAICFIIIGLARPQFGSKLQEIKRKGVEIMIALDVSNSMKAQDIQPSRLERAKQVVSKLVDRFTDDKIGLVVFAGDGYIQIPITTDYVSAKLFLSQVNTDMVPVQGTAIGKALRMAASSFPHSDLEKAIILITDGEDHEGNPVEVAREIHEKGIKIYTMGMGTPEGAPIPESPLNPTSFKKDRNGNTIITKLNEQELIKIAVAGGGEYVPGNNAHAGINKIFDKLKKLDRKEYEAKIYSEYEDKFQYFFALALILLCIEIFIIEKKSKFFKQFRLFDNKFFIKNNI